jgi:hypothetical protein
MTKLDEQPPASERLYRDAESLAALEEARIRAKAALELQHCTFKPAIRQTAAKKYKNKSASEKSIYERLHEESGKMKATLDKKIEDHIKATTPTFQPQITASPPSSPRGEDEVSVVVTTSPAPVVAGVGSATLDEKSGAAGSGDAASSPPPSGEIKSVNVTVTTTPSASNKAEVRCSELYEGRLKMAERRKTLIEMQPLPSFTPDLISPPKHLEDVRTAGFERLYKNGVEKQAKKRAAVEKKASEIREESELKECTFKPVVHHPKALDNLSKYGEKFDVRLYKNLPVKQQLEKANIKAKVVTRTGGAGGEGLKLSTDTGAPVKLDDAIERLISVVNEYMSDASGGELSPSGGEGEEMPPVPIPVSPKPREELAPLPTPTNSGLDAASAAPVEVPTAVTENSVSSDSFGNASTPLPLPVVSESESEVVPSAGDASSSKDLSALSRSLSVLLDSLDVEEGAVPAAPVSASLIPVEIQAEDTADSAKRIMSGLL